VGRTAAKPARASKYGGLPARFYDADHSWRDYSRQAGFFMALLRENGSGTSPRVLDLCCGSGSHAVRLARLGARVTGADISPDLLRLAREKSGKEEAKPVFLRADAFRLGRDPAFRKNFDGAVLFGWTISLAPLYRRFSGLLKTAERVLKPGGLFAFDAPLGGCPQRVGPKPIFYRISPRLSGALRIRLVRSAKGTETYRYLWDIREKSGAGGRVKSYNLEAEEDLKILEAGKILSAVRAVRGMEVRSLFGDYRPARPFRPGDRNLIVVMRKHVPHR